MWLKSLSGSVGNAFGIGGGGGGLETHRSRSGSGDQWSTPTEGQTTEDYKKQLADEGYVGQGGWRGRPNPGHDSNGNVLDVDTFNHGLRSHQEAAATNASSNNPQDYRILKGANAYDTAWNVANYQKDMQDNLYTPLLEDTAGQIGKSGLVDKARGSAFEQNVVGAQMAERNRSRYGQKMSNAQRAHADRGIHRNAVLDHTRASNTARISEYEYDNGLRRGMINIGRGKLESAAQGAGIATQSAAQREAAGSAAQAANQAQDAQTAAAAVGTALMIASMFVT